MSAAGLRSLLIAAGREFADRQDGFEGWRGVYGYHGYGAVRHSLSVDEVEETLLDMAEDGLLEQRLIGGHRAWRVPR